MSRRDSDEAPVIFHDVSSYFSAEEWKLLHEWQRNLYSNVMKEIHQALISLGPLITTTVFKLAAKEMQELTPVDKVDTERRRGIHHSPGEAIVSSDVLIRRPKEQELGLRNHPGTDGRKQKECFSAEEEPAAIFIDDHGAEVRDISTLSDPGHAVLSFRIKDEEETFWKDCTDDRTIEGSRIQIGDQAMNRKVKIGHSVKNPGKTIPCNIVSQKMKLKKLHQSEKGVHYGSQLWSIVNPELELEPSTQQESGFTNLSDFNFEQRTPNEQKSETYDWEQNLGNSHLFACRPTSEQKWSPHTSIECNENSIKKEHTSKPYQCTECEKSFDKKAYLFVHKRTHTGEKPYHCTKCKKSFSQKGVLNRHQRTHTGERPYQCVQCDKNFSQKRDLITHQQKHDDSMDYHPRFKGQARLIEGSFSVAASTLPATDQ